MPLYKGKNISVDIIIPTLQPGAEFAELLRSLALQVLPADNIFVINTGKEYWNGQWETEFPNLRVEHILKSEFDHGAVRHAAACLSKADIIVFMTQDALPADEKTIAELIDPIVCGKAQISYCRQVPRGDADMIESFTRNFNYPPESRIKSRKDLRELGVKTFFCTNVCCAYLRSVYDELGGFPRPVILNEDNILAGRAIEKGFSISYTAEAEVIHSHNYSGIKQFHRNFDIGVSHAMYPDIFLDFPSEGEGMRLVKQTVRYVCARKRPWLVFKVVWLSAWKYLGYSLGKRYKKLSKKTIYRFTMNPVFWDRFYENRKDKK